MSDINKKDKSNKVFSDVDYAKIVAALIGVEYPGDEYFDGTITSTPLAIVEESVPVSVDKETESVQEEQLVEITENAPTEEVELLREEIEPEQIQSEDILATDEEEPKVCESENLPQKAEEISPVLVETPQQERVRSTPFRKQSYSQWQSARLRNFAKAGILLTPEINDENEESEVLNLQDEEVITVDSILASDAPTLLNGKEKQDDTLLAVEQKEEIKENESQSLTEAISPTESVEEQIEPVIPIPVPIPMIEEENLEEEDSEEIEYEYVYDYEEPREITVMPKTSKITKEPPSLPKFNEEKPFFFARIEEKPQKIKRKNNAPLIIPADSESVGFAPKGNKYREV